MHGLSMDLFIHSGLVKLCFFYTFFRFLLTNAGHKITTHRQRLGLGHGMVWYGRPIVGFNVPLDTV